MRDAASLKRLPGPAVAGSLVLHAAALAAVHWMLFAAPPAAPSLAPAAAIPVTILAETTPGTAALSPEPFPAAVPAPPPPGGRPPPGDLVAMSDPAAPPPSPLPPAPPAPVAASLLPSPPRKPEQPSGPARPAQAATDAAVPAAAAETA